MTCPTKKPKRITSLAGFTECEKVKILEDALFMLTAGQTKIRVRHGDYEVEFQRGFPGDLKEMLYRARALCDHAQGKKGGITIGRTIGGWPCK